MSRPNIIFYFSDQQRQDTLGCYGQPLPVTPVLDQLAAQGLRFERAFTNQPVCGPARASLQSGQYATSVGCFANAISLPEDCKTLAHFFNEAGYDTAYIGKWHLASDWDSHHYETTAIPRVRQGGYHHFLGADVLEFTSSGYNGRVFDQDGHPHDFIGYRPDCINAFAVDYLHKRPKDRPFFLFVSHLEPHHQNDAFRFIGPDGSRERFGQFTPPGDLVGVAGDWQTQYPDYLGACSSLDSNLQRLIWTLKEEELWANSILVYTSDHGCHFQTRMPEYKRTCHDSSTRIPLIFHGLGITPGLVPDLVSLVDLPPTLLELAGIPVPAHYQGRSLLPFLQGQKPTDWRQEVFIQISESVIGRALRTPAWKYAVRGAGDPWVQDHCAVYTEDHLYNLQADPFERHNLVADPAYRDIRANLATRLQARILEHEGRQAAILPA